MDIIYTQLKNRYDYWCEVDIHDVPCILNVSYNTRVNKRLISITSRDGVYVFLKPTYITRDSRVYLNFTFELTDIFVYVTLQDINNTQSNDYVNWADKYRICFVKYDPHRKYQVFKMNTDD